MKKFLCLAVFAAFLGAAVGCDDKKSTPPKTTSSASGSASAKTTP